MAYTLLKGNKFYYRSEFNADSVDLNGISAHSWQSILCVGRRTVGVIGSITAAGSQSDKDYHLDLVCTWRRSGVLEEAATYSLDA
jgi:hypothetical protein